MPNRDLTITPKPERGWLEHAAMRVALREIANADAYSWQGMLAREALSFVDDGDEIDPSCRKEW